MYTDNLIKALSFIHNNNQLPLFIKEALEYLSETGNYSPRRGEFEKRIHKILNGEGHELSFDYLNAYLHAFDKLYVDGAIHSLIYGSPKYNNSHTVHLARLIYMNNHHLISLQWEHMNKLNEIVVKILSVSSDKNDIMSDLERISSFLDWINEKKN